MFTKQEIALVVSNCYVQGKNFDELNLAEEWLGRMLTAKEKRLLSTACSNYVQHELIDGFKQLTKDLDLLLNH